MAASPVTARRKPKRAPAASPEDVVEAALKTWPSRRPVLEIVETPVPQLRAAIAAAGVTLTAEELEGQLVDAGFTAHGTAAGRRRAKAAATRSIATSAARALDAGAVVYAVRTRPAPEAAPGLDAPPDPARLWHFGPPEGIPSLVASALAAWIPAGRRALVVVEGEEVLPPGRAWQAGLQGLADRMQERLSVRHAPAGLSRWVRPVMPLARIEVRLPGGAAYRTEICRVYAQRPPRWPAPRRVDVRDVPAPLGRRRVVAEGRPATRCYRLEPNPRV